MPSALSPGGASLTPQAHAERVAAQERDRVERRDTGSDLLTLARLSARGSSAELAAYLRGRGEF